MAADAGDVRDGDIVCAGLEGDAVVVVGDMDVGDEDGRAGADVEPIGVFGRVAAFGCCVHCEGGEGDVSGAAFDRVEDVGGFFWRRLEIVMSEPPLIYAEMLACSIGYGVVWVG